MNCEREMLMNIKIMTFRLKYSIDSSGYPLNRGELTEIMSDLLNIVGMLTDKALSKESPHYSIANIERRMSKIYAQLDKSYDQAAAN